MAKTSVPKCVCGGTFWLDDTHPHFPQAVCYACSLRIDVRKTTAGVWELHPMTPLPWRRERAS